MSKEPEVPVYTIQLSAPADVVGERAMQQLSWLEAYPNESAGVSQEWVEEYVSEWLKPEQIEKSREYLRDVYTDTDQLRLNATDMDGKIVGFIHASHRVRDDGGGFVEVDALYTDPATYGTGLGGQLMRRALDWASGLGDGGIELEVASYNERAIQFYKKYNFEKIDGSGRIFMEKIPTIRMKQ